MFSSTNTTFNPFPQQYYFSSSSLPPILNQETTATASASAAASDDILFHHDPLCASPFLLNISPLIPETSSVINLGVSNSAGPMTKQDMCNLYGDHHHHDHHQHQHQHHHHHHDGVPKFLSKKPIKKDRHSKIYTAQGLRDRRVRLSIEIAREFFDLQDMLGFDKASKTLEWLMGKSKKAIKDLARTKLSSGKSSSLTSECEEEEEDEQEQVNEVAGDHENQLEGEEEEEEEEEKGMVVISKSKKVLKERKLNEAAAAAAALRHLRTAKESRAKARARARERTREKMCTSTPTIFNIHDPRKCPPPCPSSSSSSSQILNQLRTTMNHHQSPKIFAEINQAIHESSSSSSSVMIKRKLMKPSSISSFQHHHHQHQHHQQQQQQLNVISSSSKGGGQTSNDNMFCPNLPQNWDINSPLIATTRPSFCAITNMNLSTELQIYGKTMGGQ